MKENEEIERFFAAMEEGGLDDSQASKLAEAIKGDPALLDRFGSLVAIERLLALGLSRDAGEHFASNTIKRISLQEEEGSQEDFVSWVIRKLRRERAVRVAFWGGGIAAVALAIFSLMSLLKEAPQEGGAAVVARIVGSETGDRRVSRDSDLRVGERVGIEDGLLEVVFSTGVKLVLNGPVDFEVTGVNSGYLHRGRLVAEIVNEQGKGFTIDGPSGRLIDLGTKFGVSVDEAGEMEVHVLEGIVDAMPKVGEMRRLRENEAMRFTGDDSKLLESADGGAFFTQMPPGRSAPLSYVRWSFDEEDGDGCLDTGYQLGEGKADAQFRKNSRGGVFPERIQGRFSNGLKLGGSGYLHSDFEGVVGAGPRTVAFWVRISEDFAAREGFGIVNWGSYAKEGAAWQVSINSLEQEGPMGRLRIGTNRGEVIGVTDLRDGEWHHCAVVLYGDRDGKPNTATHIMLYVDGRIESASRKSVLPIDTVPQGGSHKGHPGIWIGRNMGSWFSSVPNGLYGDFFRGDLDELIIFDTALNHADINKLKNDNEAPLHDE